MDCQFLVVDAKVLPNVFIKVIKAKELLKTGEAKNIQQAVKKMGISRSTYYKYKDAVFPFYEVNKTKMITISLMLSHESGILSNVLDTIAKAKGNVMTINQNLPSHGVANVTITFESREMSLSGEEIIGNLYAIRGVKKIKIIGRE